MTTGTIARRRTDLPVGVVSLFFCLLFSVGATGTTKIRKAGSSSSSGPGPRTRVLIDDGWRYTGSAVAGAEDPKFDDSSWNSINLPHTWNAVDTLDKSAPYRRGVGWYRRKLSLDNRLRNKKLFLYFEGANQVAEVFVNGHFVGRHQGGYTAFAFEITENARFDGGENTNVVAVNVNNSPDEDVPPLSGDFNSYGGIYRHVWLIATEAIHLNVLDHASQGVYVDTPAASMQTAAIRVRGSVAGSIKGPDELRVVATVVDLAGRAVASMETEVPPHSGTGGFRMNGSLESPHLWSPDDPYLYTVQTRLYAGKKEVDAVEIPLGIRWFTIDAGRGFFLNGRPLTLRGTTRHQDYQGLGNALPDHLQARDLQIIKEMGANFVRLAHYPQSPVVLDAADRLGLIVWEEIPIIDLITTSDAFTRNCREMLVEMIRQHYNHPSVIMWGYMNEILSKPRKEEGYVGRVVELARTLDKLVHEEDSNRVSVMAANHSEIYNTSGLAAVPQALGWNLYFGWYEGAFADFGAFLDGQHRRFPKRPMLVSEYGADADRRLHSSRPERFDFTVEWQRMFHQSYLRQIEERSFLVGTTLWNEFDFGSPVRGESRPRVNQKGLLTFDRRPKDIYFFYQARLSKKPVLHVATRDQPVRTGAVDPDGEAAGLARTALQTVEVYTNLRAVELFANGKSLGAKQAGSTGRATWDVPFRQGTNIIEARRSGGGPALTDRTEVRFIARPAMLADPRMPFSGLAVSAGSNAQYLDENGAVWEADQPYTPGGWGYTGGVATRTGHPIAGTVDDHLYQFGRKSPVSYRFDVPAGDYEIELRFAEPEFKDPGKRIFSIELNGRLVAERLDLVRDGGAWRALQRKFKLRVGDDAGIEIRFDRLAGEPLINALRVSPIPH